jgi:hypothetical protein
MYIVRVVTLSHRLVVKWKNREAKKHNFHFISIAQFFHSEKSVPLFPNLLES